MPKARGIDCRGARTDSSVDLPQYVPISAPTPWSKYFSVDSYSAPTSSAGMHPVTRSAGSKQPIGAFGQFRISKGRIHLVAAKAEVDAATAYTYFSSKEYLVAELSGGG
jgi:Bacterial regulatory proteins, tetR family